MFVVIARVALPVLQIGVVVPVVTAARCPDERVYARHRYRCCIHSLLRDLNQYTKSRVIHYTFFSHIDENYRSVNISGFVEIVTLTLFILFRSKLILLLLFFHLFHHILGWVGFGFG